MTLKLLLDVFEETVGVEGDLVAIQSLLNIKKGTSPLNFQSHEPFWSFYENTFYKENLYAFRA
jgi:hypothetical protein